MAYNYCRSPSVPPRGSRGLGCGCWYPSLPFTFALLEGSLSQKLSGSTFCASRNCISPKGEFGLILFVNHLTTVATLIWRTHRVT